MGSPRSARTPWVRVGSCRICCGFCSLSKPALVFAGGAWFVLYLLNRRTRTAPLLNRLFVVLLPLGALAAADAVGELAYVAIPKKEILPPAGCCVSAMDQGTARGSC